MRHRGSSCLLLGTLCRTPTTWLPEVRALFGEKAPSLKQFSAQPLHTLSTDRPLRYLCTNYTRDGLNWHGPRGRDRRPRSTPAGLRARAEAASTVLDRRPPWSLPLDSVFAPRVKGAVQVMGLGCGAKLEKPREHSKKHFVPGVGEHLEIVPWACVAVPPDLLPFRLSGSHTICLIVTRRLQVKKSRTYSKEGSIVRNAVAALARHPSSRRTSCPPPKGGGNQLTWPGPAKPVLG